MKRGKIKVTIELSDEAARMLSALGEPAQVLAQLADHAQQGIYRPGAWERDWLCQAFGEEWMDRLEPMPDSPGWQQPKGRR